MIREVQRLSLELELFGARRHAEEYLPYTPAWDAAVAKVEDLERALWRLDYGPLEPIRNGRVTEAARP